MSFRRNRGLSLRPVHSEKKEITWSQLSQNAGSEVAITLLVSVPPGDVNIANEVPTGATVKGFYIEFQFSAETITNTKIIHWSVVKEPFDSAIANPNVYNDKTKRFVFKRGMEMLPKSVNTVIKRIIFVPMPPKFRRMGEGDRVAFKYIASSSETINACGFAIYKVFT